MAFYGTRHVDEVFIIVITIGFATVQKERITVGAPESTDCGEDSMLFLTGSGGLPAMAPLKGRGFCHSQSIAEMEHSCVVRQDSQLKTLFYWDHNNLFNQ